MDYNAGRFRLDLYDFQKFPGPRPGEAAPDAAVYDQDGNEVKLSSFRGRWVVLETASVTCSMYSRNVTRMNQLARQYPDMEFVIVYVREAHPGERLGPHKTQADKLAASRMLVEKFSERRRVLVDSLDGAFHRAWGLMPNFVYLIDPDGIVHYRCDWTTVEGLQAALANREEFNFDEHADTSTISDRSIKKSLQTMLIGGWLAIWDFFYQLPRMIADHKRIDAYFKQRGRLDRPEAR